MTELTDSDGNPITWAPKRKSVQRRRLSNTNRQRVLWPESNNSNTEDLSGDSLRNSNIKKYTEGEGITVAPKRKSGQQVPWPKSNNSNVEDSNTEDPILYPAILGIFGGDDPYTVAPKRKRGQQAPKRKRCQQDPCPKSNNSNTEDLSVDQSILKRLVVYPFIADKIITEPINSITKDQ